MQTRHTPSEGTQSAVRILRMTGKHQVAMALEPLPIRTTVRPRFTPTTGAGHAAAKRARA